MAVGGTGDRPFVTPAPPSALGPAFFDWLRKMEDSMGVRLAEWEPLSVEDRRYLEEKAGAAVPPELDLFYACARPHEYGGTLKALWDAKATGAAWPVQLGTTGDCDVAVMGSDGQLEIRIFDKRGELIGKARGLRNYLVMTVAAEIVWDSLSADIAYADILARPEVARFSGRDAAEGVGR